MGEYKPLFFSLGLIFFIGGLLPFILSPFVDLDNLEPEGILLPAILVIEGLGGVFILILGFMFNLFDGIIGGIISFILSLFGSNIDETREAFLTAVNTFMEESLNFIVAQLTILSIIPNFILIPLIILTVIGLLYSIIKLLPTT